MQLRGNLEDMQPPAAPSSSTGNFHYVHRIASQGIQWLFGCLPCVKGHHQVHPTLIELSDALYIAIDGKKRIRVLHIVPDSDTSNSSGKANVVDQIDSGDRCSLDSSGEDYWFMRWNRPIRRNLQRNSCSCSFRKSQTPLSDLKALKSNGNNNDSTAAHEIESRKIFPESLFKTSQDEGLFNLAEKLTQDILEEAVQISSEIKTSLKAPRKELTDVSIIDKENFSRCCDSVCVEDINLGEEDSKVEFGGYVNPVFIASNDALDLIPSNATQNDSCDTKNNLRAAVNAVDSYQDYNANDQNQQIVAERNARNKHSLTPPKDGNSEKKKHRKSCLSSLKIHLKKPLLLMIHGAGSSSEVWKNLINNLVQCGYECVAPDLLGHGLSSAPDKASHYTFHSFLQDMLCIFDRFVVEGRSAVILGHGYGCSLAAAIARYRPEQVIQLVLISGGGPTPLAPRNPPSVSPCLRACLEPLLMCGFKRDVVYSVCGKQMEPLSTEASGVPRHIVDHISQGHVWPEGDAAFHRRIVAPTLLVHGMKDEHITLVQECEMERTIPRSFLEVIPEAGHWAMLETPTHLSHMILCFIDWWAPPNHTQ